MMDIIKDFDESGKNKNKRKPIDIQTARCKPIRSPKDPFEPTAYFDQDTGSLKIDLLKIVFMLISQFHLI
jgi:hypothetical protein